MAVRRDSRTHLEAFWTRDRNCRGALPWSARGTLLEPLENLYVDVPNENLGDILQSVANRKGAVVNMSHHATRVRSGRSQIFVQRDGFFGRSATTDGAQGRLPLTRFQSLFSNGMHRCAAIFHRQNVICERLVAAVLCICNPNPNGQLAHVSSIHAATRTGIHVGPH